MNTRMGELREKLFGLSLAAAASLLAGVTAAGSPVVIQPNDAGSKDTFVYQFLPTFNLNTGGFSTLLASGATASGHDLRSFLQFDLTGASVDAGEVATLNLWVGSTALAGFGVNPSPVAPVVTDIRTITGAWDASTVTWGTQPAFGAANVASATISDINQWVSFDVTTLVQSWIANTTPNHGFAVIQDAIVNNNGPVVAVYDSAAGVNRPYLQIGPVPEPSAALLAAGLTAGALLRRRRIS